MKQTTILFLSICFILSSCNLFQGGNLPTDTYEGFFTSGFEVSKLKPCLHPNQEWWVVGSQTEMDSLISKHKSLTDYPSEEVFVRLVGDPSKIGEHGHLGNYEREFELYEIIEIRKTESSDCD